MLMIPSPEGPIFTPTTAAKVLKAIPKPGKPPPDQISAAALRDAITLGQQTAQGDELIVNFQKMHAARKEPFGDKAI